MVSGQGSPGFNSEVDRSRVRQVHWMERMTCYGSSGSISLKVLAGLYDTFGNWHLQGVTRAESSVFSHGSALCFQYTAVLQCSWLAIPDIPQVNT